MHHNTFDEKSKLLWLGAIMQQVIAWTNDDPDLCRQMASLGHYELTWWTNSIYGYRRQTVLHGAVLMNIFKISIYGFSSYAICIPESTAFATVGKLMVW